MRLGWWGSIKSYASGEEEKKKGVVGKGGDQIGGTKTVGSRKWTCRVSNVQPLRGHQKRRTCIGRGGKKTDGRKRNGGIGLKKKREMA